MEIAFALARDAFKRTEYGTRMHGCEPATPVASYRFVNVCRALFALALRMPMSGGADVLQRRRSPYIRSLRAYLVLIAIVCPADPGVARQLQVGPHHQLTLPSAAAAIARDGDAVDIEPGRYVDCAVWSVNHLTLTGRGGEVLIEGEACEGKALFITKGEDIVIRNITFTGARVPDGNGAGIRAEGRNLTVENSRFINNEDGILATASPDSVITIVNSAFIGNGMSDKSVAHGIYIGHIALLRVVGSTFVGTKVGHHVKSRALRTELSDNTIEDTTEGTASYLVDVPNGGSLVMRRNFLQKGPKTDNPLAAIVIGAEGVTQPTLEIVVAGNWFTNDQRREAAFVRNLSATPAVLMENAFNGLVKPLAGKGSVQ
jgi:hypothetical protein